MFMVTSNPERNRLYLTLAGHMEGVERKEATKALLAEVAKLRPGFDVVTDISALHATNEEGFKDLLRAKATLKLKGIGHTIRVVKILLSRIQFDRVTGEAGYETECVNSLEEADRRLDERRGDVNATTRIQPAP